MWQTLLGANVTYISMDNIQIACPRHSLQWFHTRATRLIAQHWCNLHTTCFQTWMERHTLPRWNCPAACTCLEETRWSHLECQSSDQWLSTKKDAERMGLTLLTTFDVPTPGTLWSFPSLSTPSFAAYTQQSVLGTTLVSLHFCCVLGQIFLFPTPDLTSAFPPRTEKRPSFLFLGITEWLNL